MSVAPVRMTSLRDAPFGFLADPLFLERHMRWFVTKKQERLKEIAESAVAQNSTASRAKE